ncbi:MAG TPA: GTP cyclohydrolase I [Draconibacterium sp.]|nr:GTP cyclohydrolase I [Draconibacterium sp.]
MEPLQNNTTNNYEKIENFDDYTTDELAKNYQNILKLLGEDNLREGLDKTPERVAKAMQFLLQGYKTNPVEILQSALFKEDYRQMVIVKDSEIYSM